MPAAIKEYIITEKKVQRRLSSEIQQKLKVVMKCYTIRNFILLDGNGFSFQMSYMINKKRLDSDKHMNGFYQLENLENGTYKIRITVNSHY